MNWGYVSPETHRAGHARFWRNEMTRIFTDKNGVAVNAISQLADGTEVQGHYYQLIAGGQTDLKFQNGTIPDVGVNGITNEALLAVLIHRMNHLNGKFPCRQNSLAITKLEEAAMWLENRTKEREARGVEGQHVA